MKIKHLTCVTLTAFGLAGAPLMAANITPLAGDMPVAGFGAPVSDFVLAEARGGYGVDGDRYFSRNTPTMTRDYNEIVADALRSIGNSINDNWWSDEGATLIENNFPR